MPRPLAICTLIVAACLAMSPPVGTSGATPETTTGAAPGAAPGPHLVLDANPVSAGSDPSPIFAMGGKAYAFGCDANSIRVLWQSDGTTEGTTELAQVGSCADDEEPGTPVSLDDRMYFLSSGSLWVSDGTLGGTRPLDEGQWWGAGALTVAGDALFIGAEGLWMSDSMDGGQDSEGAVEIKTDDWVSSLTAVGATLFFVTDSGDLWTTDGTATGTLRVTRSGEGPSGLSDFTVANGRLFFLASANGESSVRQLWTSDGTEDGTHMVKELGESPRVSADSSSADDPSLTAVGDRLYFGAGDSRHGFELWQSDGTRHGTSLVKDIDPTGSSAPSNLIAVGDRLFFVATDGNERGLWRSDGTAAGTIPVGPVVPANSWDDTTEMAAVGDTLFLSARGSGGEELWRSDGTPAGTVRVKDIHPTGDSSPSSLADVRGQLFFSADDGVVGRELWTSDGTEAGTRLVADLNTASVGSDPWGFIRAGSTVFYLAGDPAHGRELWRTDGTPSGTRMVKDIRPGPEGAFWDDQEHPLAWRAALLGAKLFFVADDGEHQDQVWQTDGTEAGTKMVTGIASDEWGGTSPRQLATLDRSVLLIAEHFCGPGCQDEMGGSWHALWATDGTRDGTVLLKRSKSGSVEDLTPAGGLAFFSIATGSHSYLWKTDGTKDGTVRVIPRDFGSIWRLTAVGDVVYFEGGEGGLWRSDGTRAGSHLVRRSSGVSELTDVAGRLFFIGPRRGSLSRLWTSDGTRAGTVLLHEFDGEPTELTAVGDACSSGSGAKSGTRLLASCGRATGPLPAP
jgi:ELWxxDGT repeat protein